ncbi:MAG: hypothetical protein V2I24_03905 [Halieaceae bacterium]|nr:hypothetical protein [Halieaceae bacterium]
MSAPVELHIGTLALTGFSRIEAQRVEDAFRRELARLEFGKVAPAPARDTMQHTLAPGSRSPEAIGAAAARQLLEGLRE